VYGLEDVLRIALKIDAGIRNHDTTRSMFGPLWQHPLLLENFIAMLRDNTEFHRVNFEIIANLLSPPFLEVAKKLCATAWPTSMATAAE
jgi:hypothetical protein